MELHALKAFYDGQEGLVELEDDVLSIVRQVKEATDGKVTIHMEPTSGEYVLVEHCEDGTDRLVMTTAELDARVLERLYRGDSTSRGYVDSYAEAEAEQDRLQAQIEEQGMERVRDGV